MKLPPDLLSIAEGQHGLVTGEQIRSTSLTPDQRKKLTARGQVEPLRRGLYRISGTPRTVEQRVLAACLDVGGVASHRTAAALHGLNGFVMNRPIEVLTKSGSITRSCFARLHVTSLLPESDLITVAGIPTTSVARTLLSLAALAPEIGLDRVRDAFDEALADKKATEAWLWWRLERLRRSGRNGVTVFEALLEERQQGSITESWLERETIRVLDDAGLPIPRCQARIEAAGCFVARVDFVYEVQRAVIEVHGHRWHRSRDQMNADAKRHRRLQQLGFSVHPFTYDEIVREPEVLVSEVRHLLAFQRHAA